ncbi:ABC-F family ATP-binding cassette domain-containing protein [Prochlorococcus sp. MIT 1307]|uniref:ABC-F family ATP-binding cassette domain-containing protein n=1 Tax=Prochlorococcus sp. MIT 1307 TaxID=3096219 RepID=UPI0039BFE34D
MIEVNKGKARNYEGNYSNFLKQKTQEAKSEASSEAKLKGVLRRELAWLRQGAKARSTKQKARIQRIEKMRSNSSKPINHSLQISTLNKRIGKLVIEAKDLQVTNNGKLLFDNFSYSFSPEDRVGIIGLNGSGKSTLLDLIARRKLPTRGEIRLGETVNLGYLDQQTDDLLSGKGLERKVIDFVEEAASWIDLGNEKVTASQLLERFLFPPAQQHSPLKRLSGGEKRRLTLCRILIQAPNVLLLDEPTNDLDIQTLSVLEDFLEDFHGCVIVVSHDRYFLDRTIDKIFSFEKGLINKFEGNYSAFLKNKQYTEKRLEIESQSSKYLRLKQSTRNTKNAVIESFSQEASRATQEAQTVRRRSFKESKELEKLNHDLLLLEAQKISLEKELVKKKGNLTELSQKLAECVEKLRNAEDRWLELSELEP